MTEPLCPNCERLTNAGTPLGDERWCWAARPWENGGIDFWPGGSWLAGWILL